MEARVCFISEYLTYANKQYIIPVYQRNYEWEENDCEQLFYDILSVLEENKTDYYLGSIYLKIEKLLSSFLVIDGQQRITSLLLLLKALHDLSENSKFKNQIKTQYLINMYAEDDNKIKLKPIKKDAGVYNKLILWDDFNDNNFDEIEKESQIYINYMCFRDLLKSELNKQKYFETDILNAINKLNVTCHIIQNENPQIIFEGLNSKNKPLNSSSLILNYSLMPLEHNTQELYYEKYWLPIEEKLGSDLESFLMYYFLIYKKSSQIMISGKQSSIRKSNLYVIFKKIFTDIYKYSDKVEELFKDLYKYADYYTHCIYDTNSLPVDEIDSKLYDLFYNLDSNDSAIIILYLYDKYNSGVLSKKQFLNLIDILISYIFRCIICHHVYSKQLFTSIINKMDKEVDCSNYESILANSLINSNSKNSFPSDKEFLEGLKVQNLYSYLGSKRCKYMLYSFEKKYNKKEKINYLDSSIEHIMPQDNKKWINFLESNNDLINYDSVVDSLGNLTLTGYNSELSNDMFKEKKQLYKKSRYVLNQELLKYNKWTSVEIKERTDKLSNIALDIWKYPKSYNEDRYTLKTELSKFNLTEPTVLFINEKEYKVNTWVDFVGIAFKSYYELDKQSMIDFLKYEGIGGRKAEELIGVSKKSDYINIELDKDLFLYIAKVSDHTSAIDYLDKVKCYLDFMEKYYGKIKNIKYFDSLLFKIKNIKEEV